jgi:hypothetical protein
MPQGTWVYSRPNKYEPGRGHVAVYNWDRRRSVEADLGREKGDRHHLPERPGGCFAQMVPVPFFPESRKVI